MQQTLNFTDLSKIVSCKPEHTCGSGRPKVSKCTSPTGCDLWTKLPS